MSSPGGRGVAGLGLLAGCAMVQPAAAPGQARLYRVGLLGTASPPLRFFWSDWPSWATWADQNLVIEERRGSASADDLAAELVSLPVDLIVTASTPTMRAVMSATRSIPIVMFGTNADPVVGGFVESLAHPGGNVTGVLSSSRDLDLKRDVCPWHGRVIGTSRRGQVGDRLADDLDILHERKG